MGSPPEAPPGCKVTMAGRDRRAKGVPEGKPFVRPTERPDVGGQAFGDMAKAVSLLGDRLAKLEKKLG